MSKTTWWVDYQNDTGPNDGGFYEWWEVTDGARTFKCDSEEDARCLAVVLNAFERLYGGLPTERMPP